MATGVTNERRAADGEIPILIIVGNEKIMRNNVHLRLKEILL